MEDDTMLGYVKKGGKQIWIGKKTPYNMVAVNLLNSSNYRVSSAHHHNYETVWFYETLLDDVGKLGWKIVLDELIRLIQEEGRLIIRMRDNFVPSLPMLKQFLGRHIGIQTEIEYEKRDEVSWIWTVVFRIKRLEIEKYDEKNWTFAILTGGKKVKNVLRFLHSIRKYEYQKSEIIIVGPRNKEYDKYQVKYIDPTRFRDGQYAEISKKKNAVIKSASNANLMIVHDRYRLGPHFFSGFEKYGYDFDFLTVSQFMKDGKEFPGYAATMEHMRLIGQIKVTDLHHLYDNQYINGGLVILKTHTAKKIRFNGMLMWNQMEDVELSHVCMEHGIIPRVNFISDAVVLETGDGYFNSWIDESQIKPEWKEWGSVSISEAILRNLVRYIPVRLKYTRFYIKLKNMYFRRST